MDKGERDQLGEAMGLVLDLPQDAEVLCLVTGAMAVFYGATFPIYGACAGDYFPREAIGTVAGSWTPFYGSGAILTHWVTGRLRDVTGSYDLAFLLCALAIFLFGSNYYRMFPTNGNIIYAVILSVIFFLAAWLCKRTEKFTRYWSIAYAFGVAAVVNLVSDLFASYSSNILNALNVSITSSKGIAIAKLYDALLVITPILVLTIAVRGDLGSLFIRKGNIKWWLGIGALVLIEGMRQWHQDGGTPDGGELCHGRGAGTRYH